MFTYTTLFIYNIKFYLADVCRQCGMYWGNNFIFLTKCKSWYHFSVEKCYARVSAKNLNVTDVKYHRLPLGDDAIVASAECNRRSTESLATGTAKLNAHVLTERLSKRSLLPNKLRCLLDIAMTSRPTFLWQAMRLVSRHLFIVARAAARLPVLSWSICHSYISPLTLWVSFSIPSIYFVQHPLIFQSNAPCSYIRYKRSSCEETAQIELY